MQFREVTWSQQLHYQRLLHGAGAESTERSLPNYPGAALREIIRQSAHPQNVEPLLLTLRRPANAATRRRFAEVGGELVLIQKVTSADPVATDFKMAVHGQILDAPEGLLYPVASMTTSYETWLRVEMLDILRLMIEENLVRSLLPEMQTKLIADMLALAEDTAGHELVRLYAFGVAVAALKRFHAARPAAIRAGFAAAAAALLRHVVAGPHEAGSVYRADPFEQLKALTAAIEALYLIALTSSPQGDYTLAAGSTASRAGQDAAEAAAAAAAAAADPAAVAAAATAARAATVAACERPCSGLAGLQQQLPELAGLLSEAVGKLWQLLQDRDGFTYMPPAPSPADEEEEDQAQELTEEQQKFKAAAEEAIAASNMSFQDNWQLFLKSVYDTELVPLCGGASLQLASGLLQLLAAAEGATPVLPGKQVLAAMAGYSKQPLLAVTGSLLAATAAGGDGMPAILALPGHEEMEFAVLAKSCCACNKAEGREVKLLRCGQCGLTYYCSAACQKADWKIGHKAVCKSLQEWRAKTASSTEV